MCGRMSRGRRRGRREATCLGKRGIHGAADHALGRDGSSHDDGGQEEEEEGATGQAGDLR